MSFGNMPYPTGAEVFESLQKGSVVVLLPGAGNPEVDVVTSEVIIEVDGFSAMTNTSRLLCCRDAALIEPTGEVLNEGDYEVSPEAIILLASLTGDTPAEDDIVVFILIIED